MAKEAMSQSLREAFEDFGRNGRWGRCVSCPKDALGRQYAEMCEHFDRYDHTMGSLQLHEAYMVHIRHR